VDTFLLQLTGVLLFVGLQFLVYTIYRRTNKTLLALIPNFVFLGLTIFVSLGFIVYAEDTALWTLTILIGLFAMLVGVASSMFVSLVMIYLMKQRKNQPSKK
jgi:hypothetical protein